MKDDCVIKVFTKLIRQMETIGLKATFNIMDNVA